MLLLGRMDIRVCVHVFVCMIYKCACDVCVWWGGREGEGEGEKGG